jgi:exodeoxyribonuclease VII large subunit
MAAMTSPQDTEAPSAHNSPELTVSELSAALKRTVEDSFGRVRLRGEISQPKVAGSGHCYLRLKDENACIDGIIWRGAYARLGVRPEEGLEVIASGRLTTYPARSSYQIVIESLELAGEGALLKMLEERKRRLAAEGLFAAERKRKLPYLPRVIGVVTSPTGAVIRDILHRLNDRFPLHVLVWPVVVQGDGAAAQVAAAIEGFNALPATGGGVPRPDLLIVARGGGSLEDLMAFNEESVVRAVAGSGIPTISAVGHETDTTLCDFAADLRAPTPTGAAEMAVPVRLDLLAHLREGDQRLTGAMRRLVDDRGTRLEGLARGLPPLGRLIEEHVQRLDDRWERLTGGGRAYLDARRAEVRHLSVALRSPRELLDAKAAALSRAMATLRLSQDHGDRARWRMVAQLAGRLRPDALTAQGARGAAELGRLAERLDRAFGRAVNDRAQRLDLFGDRLRASSHESVLARGFALVRDAAGGIVESREQAPAGAALTVQFRNGAVPVRVQGDDKDPTSYGGGGGGAVKPLVGAGRKSRNSDDRQESLF